jgi:redox-sensitive bicupin YhaK (pirin superfamily)
MPNAPDSNSARTDDGAPDAPVVTSFPLGFPWKTPDPFIVTVHHLDTFPTGTPSMAPASFDGVRDSSLDPRAGGWSMYYGTDVPGFPQHPHRGFETVTFIRRGTIDHSDSLGARARYGDGDVQWLTVGSGIVHAEMFPLLNTDGPNTAELFQIWLNLPARDKMVEPHFTMLWREDIPRVVLKDDDGGRTEVTVIAGAFGDVAALPAPADSWAAKPESELAIWQFVADPKATWVLPATAHAETQRTLYVFGGSVRIGDADFDAARGIELRAGSPLRVTAGPDGAEVLVLQSRPIAEPVALGGPFVMNDQAEIRAAYADYRRTGFGGWPWASDGPVHPRETPRFAENPDGRTEFPGDES